MRIEAAASEVSRRVPRSVVPFTESLPCSSLAFSPQRRTLEHMHVAGPVTVAMIVVVTSACNEGGYTGPPCDPCVDANESGPSDGAGADEPVCYCGCCAIDCCFNFDPSSIVYEADCTGACPTNCPSGQVADGTCVGLSSGSGSSGSVPADVDASGIDAPHLRRLPRLARRVRWRRDARFSRRRVNRDDRRSPNPRSTGNRRGERDLFRLQQRIEPGRLL
jgi:hypothetical protein